MPRVRRAARAARRDALRAAGDLASACRSAGTAEIDPARDRKLGAAGSRVAVAALVAGAGARRVDRRPGRAGRVVAGAAARAGDVAGIRGRAARRVADRRRVRASTWRRPIATSCARGFRAGSNSRRWCAILSAQGFDLLGARLDRVGDRQAVAVVYRLHSHIINVFSWRASRRLRDSGARGDDSRLQRASRWSDRDMDFAAVSDTDSAELKRFAAAYRAP